MDLKANNERHQDLIIIAKNNKGCNDSDHAPHIIKYVSHKYCAECCGGDPYGSQWFCPVCDYCCGC